MAAILAGVLLLGWGALAAARALLSLRRSLHQHQPLHQPEHRLQPALDQLAVPAGVWLFGVGLLSLLVPETTLIEQGHSQALAASLVLLTLLCAVSPLSFWWARRRAQHAGNS